VKVRKLSLNGYIVGIAHAVDNKAILFCNSL